MNIHPVISHGIYPAGIYISIIISCLCAVCISTRNTILKSAFFMIILVNYMLKFFSESLVVNSAII